MRRFLVPIFIVIFLGGLVGLLSALSTGGSVANAAVDSGIAPVAQQATPTPTGEAETEAQAQPAALGERTVPEMPEAVATPGGELPRDISVQLVRVADGLDDPVNIVSASDGSGRLFVVERPGRVRVISAEGELLDEPFLDLTTDALPPLNNVLSAFLEQGLYDIEFHPNYAENGRFFVHFAELLRNGDSLIMEYAVSADNPDQADPNSGQAIMQIDQPWANHNGGELAFGPDGYLYIGSGDGGWEGDPLKTGQWNGDLLGTILRINVDEQTTMSAYTIPEDNPYADRLQVVQLFGVPEEEFAEILPENQPEIWHYGLRNPWKFHFDPETGDLFLPDVGQNVWEEINFWPADGEPGQNFGWDFLMGTHCFPIEAEECDQVGVLPIAEYSHDLGITVIGLGVYRGPDYPDLDGIYFAGDWGSGRIWGLAPDQDGAWQMEEVLNTALHITAGGNDEDGSIYVTSCECEYAQEREIQPGSVWQLVPADAVAEDDEIAPTDNE